MKHSIETHAERLATWQAAQAARHKKRSRAYRAKQEATKRKRRAERYHSLMVQRHGPTRASDTGDTGSVIRDRRATKAPHSKARRRRRNAIASASRRRNR